MDKAVVHPWTAMAFPWRFAAFFFFSFFFLDERKRHRPKHESITHFKHLLAMILRVNTALIPGYPCSNYSLPSDNNPPPSSSRAERKQDSPHLTPPITKNVTNLHHKAGNHLTRVVFLLRNLLTRLDEEATFTGLLLFTLPQTPPPPPHPPLTVCPAFPPKVELKCSRENMLMPNQEANNCALAMLTASIKIPKPEESNRTTVVGGVSLGERRPAETERGRTKPRRLG